jgi:hypothetical protein
MSALTLNNYINSDTSFGMTCAIAIGAACMMLCATTAISLMPMLIDQGVRQSFNGENTKDSKVALILTADPGPINPVIGVANMAKLHLQNHTSIIYKDITITDFDKTIKSVIANNNTITELYLRMHNDTDDVENENVEHIKESLKLLAEDATITLHSCWAGKTKNNSSCTANAIAKHAAGRRVVASSSIVNDAHAYVQWEGTSLKTRFGKASGSTRLGKFCNEIISRCSFGYLGFKDTTVDFLHPN